MSYTPLYDDHYDYHQTFNVFSEPKLPYLHTNVDPINFLGGGSLELINNVPYNYVIKNMQTYKFTMDSIQKNFVPNNIYTTSKTIERYGKKFNLGITNGLNGSNYNNKEAEIILLPSFRRISYLPTGGNDNNNTIEHVITFDLYTPNLQHIHSMDTYLPFYGMIYKYDRNGDNRDNPPSFFFEGIFIKLYDSKLMHIGIGRAKITSNNLGSYFYSETPSVEFIKEDGSTTTNPNDGLVNIHTIRYNSLFAPYLSFIISQRYYTQDEDDDTYMYKSIYYTIPQACNYTSHVYTAPINRTISFKIGKVGDDNTIDEYDASGYQMHMISFPGDFGIFNYKAFSILMNDNPTDSNSDLRINTQNGFLKTYINSLDYIISPQFLV